MQLQKDSQQIAEHGIQVVAISYDSVDVLKKFAKKNSVEFPLLADSESTVIKQFGLLNGTAKPGSRKSGMAYPMTILVDRNGVVKAKLPATVRLRHNGEQLVKAWLSASKGNAVRDPAWRQFNGSHGHAVGPGSLPTEWSETKNVAWKTPIPGSGWSSPIVDGSEIWLTTSIDEQHSLRALCINAESGKVSTNVEVFKPKALLAKHARNGHATPTPVLDKEHVYVHFGSYGTAALKRSNGDIVWTNQNTKINHQWGPGSSPVLVDDMVIFNCDGMEQRYVIALNKKTGKQKWKTTRSQKITKGGFFRKAFSTPSVVSVNGKTMLLSAGANQVTTFDPKTGTEGWSVGYFGYAGVTKPIIADGRAFVTSGYGDGSLMAVQLSDAGGRKSGELLWKTDKGAPIIPSPIVVGSELYMVSDTGILSCLDVETGKVHWRDRLPGNYAASIAFGDGKLFVHNDKGLTTVFAPSLKGLEKLSVNQLDSNIQASPALINGSIYLRTEKSLYRIDGS